MTELAKVLKDFRERHCFSKRKASDELSVHYVTWGRWENGGGYHDSTLWKMKDKIEKYEKGARKKKARFGNMKRW